MTTTEATATTATTDADGPGATIARILAQEPQLRRTARRLARCESDADDLVQETLFRAYRARDRLQPGTSVGAWTTIILRRVFLSGVARARRRRLQNDTDAGAPLDAAADRGRSRCDDPAPTVDALCEVLDDDVRHAFDRLPEIHRTSLFLSAVRDLSCAEIGHRLQVPIGTVMSRIHRARNRLREDLAPRRRTLRFALRAAAAGRRGSRPGAPRDLVTL